eukprot:CAMPEP_0182824204 /NCGR_PEP_ID=MMETSP0006_2-20121128/15168_1 /TAXON_ID=97485 /ORGANISM="Prymnesium parvum, Strain Texoma1" /LENGTH=101 /DNA_ID=CAMNT_0024951191 /DNA_START=415 /DNA_END=717 /DNA_ORIENTATION=-
MSNVANEFQNLCSAGGASFAIGCPTSERVAPGSTVRTSRDIVTYAAALAAVQSARVRVAPTNTILVATPIIVWETAKPNAGVVVRGDELSTVVNVSINFKW